MHWEHWMATHSITHCPHHIFPVKNTSPRAQQGQNRGQSHTHPDPLPKHAELSFYSFSEQGIHTSLSTRRESSSKDAISELPLLVPRLKAIIKATLWFLLASSLLGEAPRCCGFRMCPLRSALHEHSPSAAVPHALGSDPVPPQPSPPQALQACHWEMNGFAFLSFSFLSSLSRQKNSCCPHYPQGGLPTASPARIFVSGCERKKKQISEYFPTTNSDTRAFRNHTLLFHCTEIADQFVKFI